LRDLKQIAPNGDILFDASDQVYLPSDQAINVALVVTELVTNAAKHGYPETHGTIWVRLDRPDNRSTRI
jgi:two-component sensor histidine kinase